MAATAEEREGNTFNELVALLLRNEDSKKHAADVEMDMRRLLMLARDAHLRDQFVQAQGVRRVTLIATSATNNVTRRLCAGAAALLAFSTQNHCQLHLDKLGGISVLLKILDVKQADYAATDVAIYSAAILWNMCKAPALLLKLETIYGVLKDQLTRKLSNLLIAPFEPVQLFLTPTGERGMPVLLDFEGENLNVLVTASISTQLSVVLAIENYVGRARSLADQFRPKTPPASAVVTRSRALGGSSGLAQPAGASVAHYDESGVLASRTCVVCTKLISVKPSRRKRIRPSLLCSRPSESHGYHLRRQR
ncbi:uncharacterized protein PITG_00378 [Phytophthora infestans T30-4]|uniref:Uncharacterized protein n=1 Tax=Phytophthora infestans (strain T30-4) TaxID=403677 RepID=D0MQM7_PHYIT|nr:uncharacterized protein PITG_00378 [Phytophthora infestans T30-4]EEY57796.1 hypothetical protein PITG_00378 [Phytophthora infestans T30-4]|eukprot:XP_002908982.1 hypothetical protein PITG_00378 [Phytophthora infestans T30-4]